MKYINYNTVETLGYAKCNYPISTVLLTFSKLFLFLPINSKIT